MYSFNKSNCNGFSPAGKSVIFLLAVLMLLLILGFVSPVQKAYAKAAPGHAALTDGASWPAKTYDVYAAHAANTTSVTAGHTTCFNFAFEKGRYITSARLYVRWSKGSAWKTIDCKKRNGSKWVKLNSKTYYRLGKAYAQVKRQDTAEGEISWFWAVSYSSKSYKASPQGTLYLVSDAGRAAKKRSANAEARSVIKSLAKNAEHRVAVLQLDQVGQTTAVPTRALGRSVISLSKTRYAYTGSAIKPKLNITYKGKALESGTDYVVAYTTNKEIGTATVSIEGRGSYYGGSNIRFDIVKAKNTLTVDLTSKTYKYETLASKDHSFSVGAKGGVGEVTFSRSRAARLAGMKISSKGVITVPKGYYFGSYVFYVKAAGNDHYKAASFKVTLKVSGLKGFASIVNRAKAELGKPYGAAGVGPYYYDCSGFVGYCVTGKHKRIFTTYNISSYAKRISKKNAVPGDIVSHSTHMGLYLGNGMMIHASQPGDVVKISPVEKGMSYYRYR